MRHDVQVTDTKLSKSAGEFWVASVLSALGWGAALTRDGLERTDILAVWPESGATIQVQVKTSSFGKRPAWRVGSKAQQIDQAGNEWFVFVALAEKPGAAPVAYVVPRNHVWAAAWIQHRDWLTDPSVEPGKRNSPLSEAWLHPSALAGYEGQWDLMRDPSADSPVLLPARFRELALDPRVGLPDGHPWTQSLPNW